MFVKELEITLENGMKISGELDLPERQGQMENDYFISWFRSI